MGLKERKLFLEVYGLLRMTLGIVQLMGLFSGYFLNEFIIRYPSQVMPSLFNSDIVALVYLAVVLRSIFHMVSGIGVSRLQIWARFWILSGWPIVMIVNMGMAYAFYQEWLVDGYALKGFFAIINWLNLFIYSIFILFDFLFVNISIKTINADQGFIEGTNSRLEKQKIGILFFAIIFAFSVVLFLGKPIRQGFHRGFYKVRAQRKMQGKEVNALEAIKDRDRAGDLTMVSKKSKEPVQQIIQKRTEVSILVDDSLQKGDLTREIKGVKKEGIKSGLSYREMIGFAAGLCLVIGLLLQLLQIDKLMIIKDSIIQSYLFLCIGFFILIFYGVVYKLTSLWVSGSMCCLASFFVLLSMLKGQNDTD